MSKTIPLDCGFVATVDDEDYGRLSQHGWTRNAKGYAYSSSWEGFKGRVFFMHRAVFTEITDWTGIQADHINGDRLDNRQANLRIVDAFGNAQNQGKRKTMRGRPTSSKYKGVTRSADKGKWEAAIQAFGVRKSLGYYKAEEHAALAYDRAARERHGEHARLNFPAVADYSSVPARPERRGFRGVSKQRNKWRARISVGNRDEWLGLFDTEEHAARAYDAAARRHFGSKAQCNFPAKGERGE